MMGVLAGGLRLFKVSEKQKKYKKQRRLSEPVAAGSDSVAEEAAPETKASNGPKIVVFDPNAQDHQSPNEGAFEADGFASRTAQLTAYEQIVSEPLRFERYHEPPKPRVAEQYILLTPSADDLANRPITRMRPQTSSTLPSANTKTDESVSSVTSKGPTKRRRADEDEADSGSESDQMDIDDDAEGRQIQVSEQDTNSANEIKLTWPSAFSNKKASGLVNLGNTCYINSVLQALLHTPPLVAFLSSNLSSATPTPSTLNHMSTLLRNHYSGKAAYVPRIITSNLKSIAKGLSVGRQEDAHEFMRHLIDGMHMSLLKDIPKKQHATHQTAISRMFGGKLRSRVTCSVCNFQSDTFDPFLDLSIDIRRCKSIEDSLGTFTAIEKLQGSGKYNCEKCKKPVNATKRFTIDQAPPCLTVHLKRFSPLGGKLSHTVSYGEHLSLKSHMSDAKDAPKYRLYAVVSHAGSSTRSGHYYSQVRTINDRWMMLNDDEAVFQRKVPLNEKSAYMLLYLRERDDKTVLQKLTQTSSLATTHQVKPPYALTRMDDTEADLGEPVHMDPSSDRTPTEKKRPRSLSTSGVSPNSAKSHMKHGKLKKSRSASFHTLGKMSGHDSLHAHRPKLYAAMQSRA